MAEPKEILKEARENKGYTQTELALKLGIGLRMYQKIEDGQFPKYKKDQISTIDQLLGTNLYELIYEQKPQLSKQVSTLLDPPEPYNFTKKIKRAYVESFTTLN